VDGKNVGEKMSKSLDNYVGISEAPDQMFGKLMSITDDLMWRYYELLSFKPLKELHALRAAVEAGPSHPKAAKVAFAQEITARFHGDEAGRKAVEAFEARFANKQLDTESLPLVEVALAGAAKLPVTKVLPETKLVASATEARKLMAQGGVRVNGEKVTDPKAELGPGEYLVQVGKLKAAKVKLA
jgi:tyrosyl-tRNA synthetase